MATFLLVHSPLVGPFTWAPVAEVLGERGESVIVPSLLPALGAGPPYWRRIVERVLDAADGDGGGDAGAAVLVTHSAAGAYVPAMRAGLGPRIAGYVFVDARLPSRDASLFQSGPLEMAEQLRAVARDGLLPPWSEWFGEEVMRRLLPDDALRERFVAELPRVPLALFEEPIPGIDDWPDARCAYYRLSEGYRNEAEQARARGWPAVERDGTHLDMLTRPGEVAESLLELTRRAGIA